MASSSTSAAHADETAPLLGPGPADPAPGAMEPAETARNMRHNMAIIFPAITIGIFLAAADGTIVLVSYATISSELEALNLASWIVTAYSLTLASCQPLYGKLSDVFGRKQCLLAAYVIFAAGCLACGMAQSIGQLIAARVLQAVGGSGLGTIVAILLTNLVPREDRGIWQAAVNIVYSLGAGLGAPIGGVLAGSLGWRWSFFGQVPICALAFLAVSLFLDGDIGNEENDTDETKTLAAKLRRIDFLGSATLILTIASLMFALDRGSNVSWTVPETSVSFLISAIAALAFLQIEFHVAKEPVVPPSTIFSAELFPIYSSGFLCFFAIMSLDYVLPLFYQAREAMNASESSLYLIPSIVAGTCSASLTGWWMRRSGQYYWSLMLAFTLQTSGALIGFLVSGSVTESVYGLIASHVVTEFGVGNAVVSGLIAVISNGDGHSIAVITAAYYSLRNLGSVLGASAMATIIQQALHNFLTVQLEPFNVDVNEIIEQATRSLESIRELEPDVAYVVRQCYGQAINRSFLFIFVAALCTLIPASLIRGGKRSRTAQKQLERD